MAKIRVLQGQYRDFGTRLAKDLYSGIKPPTSRISEAFHVVYLYTHIDPIEITTGKNHTMDPVAMGIHLHPSTNTQN